MFKRNIFLIILSMYITSANALMDQAVVQVPVADCVGQALSNFYPQELVEKIYSNIPISWAGSVNTMYTCPRIHQLLFNEVVTIIEQQGDEILVEIPQMFYEKLDDPTRFNQFWTLKKNLANLSDIKSSYIKDVIIPKPLQHIVPQQPNDDTVALMVPYYNAQTDTIYSAGTRFALTDTNDEFFTISFYDHVSKTVITDNLPSSMCYHASNKSINEKIKDFVSLLRLWARSSKGSIPLVWGGISFTHWYPDTSCNRLEKTLSDGQTIEYWQPKKVQSTPFAGFDASSLVLRAAQICGIPYFFKNTTTAAKNLRPLNNQELLEEGDILWVPGGTLVISNLEKNKILTVIGYQFGYGNVVELEIEKLFVDIHTYQDLMDAYHKQKSIQTKKADGSISRTISDFKLLKLSSVWE